MERHIKISGDGSSTVFVPGIGEYYHSLHGAIPESLHVFIKEGYRLIKKNEFKVFEMGFGTGLNTLLTWIECKRTGKKVFYETIDLYPLDIQEITNLNYTELLPGTAEFFLKIHESPWGKKISLDNYFDLLKKKIDLLDHKSENEFDLVYFDAFSPKVQPGLWKEEVLKKIFELLTPGGIMTTYCVKGDVRRTLLHLGFKVEKIPGPPGKMEMLRAVKD
ncbi:MAG: tRNA (5-methylaminomethyl-2-thiouridine)(34)-methyltransferase MnmD [bacterium]